MIENEKLTLRGVRDIKNHVPPIKVEIVDGVEVRTPQARQIRKLGAPGGKTSFRLKRWWLNGVSTTYTDATVFSITTDAGTVKLAIDSGISTNLGIRTTYNTFDIIFSIFNEVGRAALFTEDWKLIEHYMFPKISRGKVITITPPAGDNVGVRPDSSSPGVETATSIGTVTVTGDTSPSDGDTVTYTAAVSGDASNLSYAWSMNNSGTVISFNGASVQGEWSGTDESTVTCIVTSNDSDVTDSPSSGSITVTPV